MLKIRLKRTGRKGQPHYRIVVMESSKPRDSKSIEQLGYYNPRTNPTTLRLDKDKVKEWLAKGAQPTDTMEQILVREGILDAISKGSTAPKKRKKKKEQAEESN